MFAMWEEDIVDIGLLKSRAKTELGIQDGGNMEGTEEIKLEPKLVGSIAGDFFVPS